MAVPSSTGVQNPGPRICPASLRGEGAGAGVRKIRVRYGLGPGG